MTTAVLKEDLDARRYLAYDPDYDRFLLKLKRVLDANQLKERALNEIFSLADNGVAHPQCDGTWLEAGVAAGGKQHVQ